MNYHQQINKLLEYANSLKKDSWQYDAIWCEITKLEKLMTGTLTPFDIWDYEYQPPMDYDVFSIWEASKKYNDLSSFKKALYRKKIEIHRV